MYNQYQSPALTNEVQRLITQLQQNERNTANTLHAIANQLQNLAAAENQSNAMLQQLYSLTTQLSFEAARVNQFQSIPQTQTQPPQTSTPGYETVRSSVNPTTTYANYSNANFAQNTPQASSGTSNNTSSHSLLQNQATSANNTATAQDSILNHQSFHQS